jgi:ABC-2 type transport system ATP-binding protein
MSTQESTTAADPSTLLSSPNGPGPEANAAESHAEASSATRLGKPMIEIEGLRKEYGQLVAVKDLNLTVREGELFCVLGPNGAGKTTTIKILTGLLRPTRGVARIGGFDIQKQAVEAKRLIGYIPDHPYLYEKLSGRDFFRFVADLFGVPREVWEPRMEYYFQLFKLTNRTDQLIENYSHGMRQKLCFSVALMHDPKVIIVDEPMVGLDPHSSRVVKDLLREHCRRGACVFLSTHLLAVAEEIADRLIIFSRGEAIFEGTLPELHAMRGRKANLEELFLEMTDGDSDESA